jgi:hypothetical protein
LYKHVYVLLYVILFLDARAKKLYSKADGIEKDLMRERIKRTRTSSTNYSTIF